VPGGASGVLRKLNALFRQAWAESLGYWCDERSRLIVNSARGMRRSHSERGKFGSQVASQEQKWFFQV
jgi:hypothetical protein